jgi:hypothetical protein
MLDHVWDTSLLNTENGSPKLIAAWLDKEFTEDERKSWEAGTLGAAAA